MDLIKRTISYLGTENKHIEAITIFVSESLLVIRSLAEPFDRDLRYVV